MYGPMPCEAPVTRATRDSTVISWTPRTRAPHTLLRLIIGRANDLLHLLLAAGMIRAMAAQKPGVEYPKALDAKIGFLLARAHLIARAEADRVLGRMGLTAKGYA